MAILFLFRLLQNEVIWDHHRKDFVAVSFLSCLGTTFLWLSGLWSKITWMKKAAEDVLVAIYSKFHKCKNHDWFFLWILCNWDKLPQGEWWCLGYPIMVQITLVEDLFRASIFCFNCIILLLAQNYDHINGNKNKEEKLN